MHVFHSTKGFERAGMKSGLIVKYSELAKLEKFLKYSEEFDMIFKNSKGNDEIATLNYILRS